MMFFVAMTSSSRASFRDRAYPSFEPFILRFDARQFRAEEILERAPVTDSVAAFAHCYHRSVNIQKIANVFGRRVRSETKVKPGRIRCILLTPIDVGAGKVELLLGGAIKLWWVLAH